jgi:hypothetical protein
LTQPGGDKLGKGEDKSDNQVTFQSGLTPATLAMTTLLVSVGMPKDALGTPEDGFATEAAVAARMAILALAAFVYRRQNHDSTPDETKLYSLILQFVYHLCGGTDDEYILLMNALKITLLCLKCNWADGKTILAAKKENTLSAVIEQYTDTMMAKDVIKHFFYKGNNTECVMACFAMTLLLQYYKLNKDSQDTLSDLCLMLLPSPDKVDTYQWKTWEFWKAESAHVAHVFLMDLVGLRLIDINKRMDLGLWAPFPVLAVVAMKLVVAFCTDVEHPHPFDRALRLSRGWLGMAQKESSPSLLRELAAVCILYSTGSTVMAAIALCKAAHKTWYTLKGKSTLEGQNVLDVKAAVQNLVENPDEQNNPVQMEVCKAIAVAFYGNDSAVNEFTEFVGQKRKREVDVESQGGSSPKRGKKE